MTTARLQIDIWTDGDKTGIPSDLGSISEMLASHVEHVATLCEQGYVAGEICSDNFRGWWKIGTGK